MRSMAQRRSTVGLGVLLLAGTACGSGSPAAAPTSKPAAEPKPVVTSVARAASTPAAAKPASGPSSSELDACSLVTPSEAETILGRLKDGEPKREESPLLQSGCTFSTQQGQQTIIELDDGEKWIAWKEVFLAGKDLKPTSGLGTDAYGGKGPTGGAQLAIYQAPYFVNILCIGGTGGPDQAARRLAEKALSRLK
jgi:hypothetical protein